MHIFRLDDSRETDIFLRGRRRDPVTGEPFQRGESVVFCKSCRSAFRPESWEYLGGRHCDQAETLKEFPKADEAVLFISEQGEYGSPVAEFTEFRGVVSAFKGREKKGSKTAKAEAFTFKPFQVSEKPFIVSVKYKRQNRDLLDFLYRKSTPSKLKLWAVISIILGIFLPFLNSESNALYYLSLFLCIGGSLLYLFDYGTRSYSGSGLIKSDYYTGSYKIPIEQSVHIRHKPEAIEQEEARPSYRELINDWQPYEGEFYKGCFFRNAVQYINAEGDEQIVPYRHLEYLSFERYWEKHPKKGGKLGRRQKLKIYLKTQTQEEQILKLSAMNEKEYRALMKGLSDLSSSAQGRIFFPKEKLTAKDIEFLEQVMSKSSTPFMLT